jgi:hypothetical protein
MYKSRSERWGAGGTHAPCAPQKTCMTQAERRVVLMELGAPGSRRRGVGCCDGSDAGGWLRCGTGHQATCRFTRWSSKHHSNHQQLGQHNTQISSARVVRVCHERPSHTLPRADTATTTVQRRDGTQHQADKHKGTMLSVNSCCQRAADQSKHGGG